MSEHLVTVTQGDTIRIIPDKGPERVMVVSHVEHHVITLSDPAASGPARQYVAPVETGDPWRGAAQGDWDESR